MKKDLPVSKKDLLNIITSRDAKCAFVFKAHWHHVMQSFLATNLAFFSAFPGQTLTSFDSTCLIDQDCAIQFALQSPEKKIEGAKMGGFRQSQKEHLRVCASALLAMQNARFCARLGAVGVVHGTLLFTHFDAFAA